MKLFISIFIVILFSSITFASEKDVLKLFERTKAATETGVNFSDYSDLVIEIKTEINILKRNKNANASFISKADECFGNYDSALDAWRLKNDSADISGLSAMFEASVSGLWQLGNECIDELYQVQN